MYDLIVLGGGSGGLNVASAAAAVGAKVALIEKGKLGGECTHTACVPSKALIHAARLVREIRHSGAYGIEVPPPRVDFPAVMRRVRGVVSSFAGSDSGGSLRAKGIDVYRGSPAFEGYDSIVIDGRQRLSGARVVIATGSRPAIPPIPGLEEAGYLDNTTFWDLDTLPASLVVLGAGPVGLELGQALARFGVTVTVLDHSDHILSREDPEVSALVRQQMEAEGMEFRSGVEVVGVTIEGEGKVVRFRDRSGGTAVVRGAEILVATGRRANVEGLNLEAIGLVADPSRGIEVDDYLQTRARHVYALGDVIGHHQWTHAAEREAACVFQNAVLRVPKRIDYTAMPWATFTDPEVATVGLSESEALAREPDARVLRADLGDVDRYRIDGETVGFAKVLARPSGTVLGATIVGPEAALVLQEFVLAMEHGLTLADLAGTVHPYPTHAGLARKLANQFMGTRLERGVVKTALRWFLGFSPRAMEGPPPGPEPAGHGEGSR